jgi:hypothetical protein
MRSGKRQLAQRIGFLSEQLDGGGSVFLDVLSEPSGKPRYQVVATTPAGEEVAIGPALRCREAVLFADGLLLGAALWASKKHPREG